MDLTRIYLFLILIFLGSCKPEKQPKTINRAVYFWKTTFDLRQKERAFLDENKVEKIYLRFFDVDILGNEAVPKGILRLKSKVSQEIIPTVFITNRVFEKTKINEIENLAERIVSQIQMISNSYREIQIDCDWTLGTKEKYFYFLKTLREKTENKIKLSATIRLHQIKFYEKTGIPPVDEGILMLYNTGEWRKLAIENSIFDPRTVLKYLDNLSKYPMELNFAFPIFQQVLVYRNGIFYTFIKNCSSQEILGETAFEKAKIEGQFLCKNDVQFKNISFRKNDILKFENVNLNEIETIKIDILKNIKANKTTLILYHLDEKNISNFDSKKISKLFSEN
ncbi:hypothetical protein [Lacihabitans sp. LS3-19]|uniref:hypothetical protein n=1 Tax=Lacihabitans sp. LS3-19 TaxID=2487335 RepID=UPI0020CD5080|nr:hypothetical protein [Lacihabitans sp. LS3-19]